MTIMIARAGTAEGQAALDAGLAEAARRDEDAVIFHLGGDDSDAGASELRGVRVAHRTPEARGRDAVGDLLDAAEAVDASLIVVGIRHRSPMGKLLLGSAAQQILLESACPVLAVKPERT
ncbi:universal stress protein [Kocuria palustris]|uniref:universal stress protein n=1 Tax=Kocuria palustris TaxID=71999 RepID=UPI0011A84ECA|nr:universal stress protein [Kocuria palustris]